jgi:hypothetical protein
MEIKFIFVVNYVILSARANKSGANVQISIVHFLYMARASKVRLPIYKQLCQCLRPHFRLEVAHPIIFKEFTVGFLFLCVHFRLLKHCRTTLLCAYELFKKVRSRFFIQCFSQVTNGDHRLRLPIIEFSIYFWP